MAATLLFTQPSYQVVGREGRHRVVPDVAMDADPNTGMLIGETQIFPDGTYYDQYRIGGTSLASPLFAGFTLAIPTATARRGFINPTMYANEPGTPVIVTCSTVGEIRIDYANGVDGTAGLLYSVRTFDQDSTLTIGKGWDDVTGLGAAGPAWLSVLAP